MFIFIYDCDINGEKIALCSERYGLAIYALLAKVEEFSYHTPFC